MSGLVRRAAMAVLVSMALAMPAPARAQPPDRPPAATAPATAQSRPDAPAPTTWPDLPVAPPAEAPIVTMPPLTTVHVERYWYLLMLADVSWLWASLRLGEEKPAFVAYPALAPAVHLLMDNGRGALQSMALRVGVEALAYVYVYVVAENEEDDRVRLTGAAFLGAAALFDWFYLGKRLKTVPLPARRSEAPASASTWTWTPGLVAGAHGLQLGISGAF
jgi:hypothetical protein